MQSLTYGELLARALAIAGFLATHGAAGERVIVMHPPGLEFVAALYGCWLAGATAVPSYPVGTSRGRTGSRLAGIVADVRPILALCDRRGRDRAVTGASREPGFDSIRWFATDEVVTASGELTPTSPRNPAVIQYTSGSTAAPRGVVLTHANLLANIELISTQTGIPIAERKVVAWLPPYHDMGLIGVILTAVTCGYPLVMMDPIHFLERPLRWLTAISDHRASVSAAANFAFDLCVRTTTPEQRAQLDLRNWRVVCNGAETVRAATIDRFTAAFGPCGFRREAFLPCYGLAEATLMVTCGKVGEMPRVAEGNVSCGAPAQPTIVAIAGTDGVVLPDGQTGEIFVAGPGVASGYWNSPEETSRVFGQKLIGVEGDFLRTGDLGSLRGGELFVSGRLKELIVIRGHNYYPQDFEIALASAHPALAPDSFAAFPLQRGDEETYAVVCEVRRERRRDMDSAEVFDAVERTLTAVVGVAPAGIALVRPGAMPRTTSGKIQRYKCARLIEDESPDTIAVRFATLQVIHPDPAGTNLEASIRACIASLRGVDPARLDDVTPLAELGVDSLMQTELLMALEASLGLCLESGTIRPALSVAQLADAIRAQREFRTTPACSPAGLAGAEIPLAPQQRRFLEYAVEYPDRLATVVIVRTPALIGPERLSRAIEKAELEFDALRLRFAQTDSGWRQHYAAAGGSIAIECVSCNAATPLEIAAQRERIGTLHTGLNLERGPLGRAIIFDRGPLECGVLALCLHHLVADGLSMAIFAGAIERHLQLPDDALPRLAEPTFGAWAGAADTLAQSTAVIADLEMWERICGRATGLSPAPGVFATLPDEFLDAARQNRFDKQAPSVTEQRTHFLAALWEAWKRVTGEPDLLVWMENNGRSGVEGMTPDRTLGWFACEYPVRLEPVTGEPVRDVQIALDAIPGAGASYGMLRYLHREPSVRSRMAELAAPQVWFRFLRGLHHAGRRGKLRLIRTYSTFGGTGQTRIPPVILTVQQKNAAAAWNMAFSDQIGKELPTRLMEGIGSYMDRLTA